MSVMKSLASTISFVVRHPLNSHRRLEAVKRWAKWQIGSRLVPGAVAVTFVNDVAILVEPGLTGATGNLYAGLHEFEDMAFVLHTLRQDDLFVDVGANVGSYTLLAGAAGARGIAVEPIGATFRRLERNLALNSLGGRIAAHRTAVGREEGTVSFTAGLDTENHLLPGTSAEPGASEVVPINTLDRIVGDGKPRLMKIDVEGFETGVIDGAEAVLACETLDAVLMELTGLGPRYGFDEEVLHRRMLGYGFAPFSYAPFERTLTPACGRNTLGNTLYVRNLERVAARLKDAPRFRVADRWL